MKRELLPTEIADIETFQKIVRAMRTKQNMTKQDIMDEAGITAPTMDKLIQCDPEDAYVRPKTIKKITEFVQLHRKVLSAPTPAKQPPTGKVTQKELDECMEAAQAMVGGKKNIPEPDFWTAFGEVSRRIPDNVTIKIKIN